MIDKKELRIGNLLKCGDNIVEVEDIGDDGINLQWFHEMSGFDYDYNQLSPIELTPEWLEKMGFEKDDNDFLIKIDDRSCIHLNLQKKRCLIESYDGVITLMYSPYIHSVQNLYFSLIGKELELKNN